MTEEESINEKQKISITEHVLMRDPQTGKEIYNRRCAPTENHLTNDEKSYKDKT